MTRAGVCAVLATALLMAGCGGGTQSRQAAGGEGALLAAMPACDIDMQGNCSFEVSLDGADRVVVHNGATVVFTRNGDPVQAADLSNLCLSLGDDTEAGSCTEDGKQPPAEVDIRATSVSEGGKQWPALSVKVGYVFDIAHNQGYEYLPLPATALMGVRTDEGTVPITVEVACCTEWDEPEE